VVGRPPAAYILAHGQSKENQTPRTPVQVAGQSIKGTPAKFIDFVEAPDAATAEKQVAEAHRIPDALRDRLVAIRDDW
jgi:hypothetical protein